MSLLPRTLFHRNLLLIVALILMGQVASALLFRQLVMKPRVKVAAEATVRNLQALQEGLRGLPPEQRGAFVERFNAQARKEDATAERVRGKRLTLLERAFMREVSARLAERGGEVQWRRDADRLLALHVGIGGEHYWLELPGLLPAQEFSGAWLVASGATVALAVLGAWLIQRRINRPLNELVQAAAALGRGQQPPALSPEAPSEIATVAHAFNDMAASLSRTEEERALMLAGLSHDLRTPLAKMRLASEMLDGQADGELVATLNRNIEGMDRLLSQFLDFTRSSGGTQEAPVEADLDALVGRALVLCPPDGVTLRLGDVPHRPLRCQAVERLVLNLVVNAQRHGRPPIEVATGHGPAGLWLEVRDRGPGIAPADAEALKEPFARGDRARGGPAGAGLGLAIVDRIAKAHGARFELLPREGGGLVARVTWPD